MPQAAIDSTVSNPDRVFYNKNNGRLIFEKEGDVVVVDNRGQGVTAFGKSSDSGQAVPVSQINGGDKGNKVFLIEDNTLGRSNK